MLPLIKGCTHPCVFHVRSEFTSYLFITIHVEVKGRMVIIGKKLVLSQIKKYMPRTLNKVPIFGNRLYMIEYNQKFCLKLKIKIVNITNHIMITIITCKLLNHLGHMKL